MVVSINIYSVAGEKLGIHKVSGDMPDYSVFFQTYRPENRLAILRNPWARLVSAYENNVIEHGWWLEVRCGYDGGLEVSCGYDSG